MVTNNQNLAIIHSTKFYPPNQLKIVYFMFVLCGKLKILVEIIESSDYRKRVVDYRFRVFFLSLMFL